MRNSFHHITDQLSPAAKARIGLALSLAAAGVLVGIDGARGGPCAEDIVLLERQIANTPGPQSGAMGAQTIGAQLHRQPTPGSVQRAEKSASSDAEAALNSAKEADSSGNAVDCNAALKKARELYGIF
jgi:hypothetical protein